MKKRTAWDIEKVREFIRINGNGDELISTEYFRANDKLEYRCHICGNIYSAVWFSYTSGMRHQKCMAQRPMEDREYSLDFMRNFIESFGCHLEQSEVSNINGSIKIRCGCGRIWKTYFRSFRDSDNHCCRKCSSHVGSSKRLLNFENIKEFARTIGYQILDINYSAYDSKFNMIDNEGYKYFASYQNLKTIPGGNRSGLAKFGRNNPYSMENAKKWIRENNCPVEITGDEFSVTECVIGVKCSFCGHNWNTSWDKIYHEVYCPKCKTSSGEIAVENILQKYHVPHKYHFKFDDCRSKRPLIFDFYIPSLNIAAEYQGEQHFLDNGYFGGTEKFLEGQMRDQIKRDYCKEKNIRLLEIPYWEKSNIEQILTKELNLQEGR